MTRSESLASYASGAMTFKPNPKVWSVREVIHHMPDSEINSVVRCRKIIAESGTTVSVYDQDVWANGLKYQRRDIKDALELFRLLRSYTVGLLRTVDEAVWQDNFVMHPEDGRLTLEKWLGIYANHVDKHIGQIQRNVEVWEKAGGPA
jgi:hypothetical protein